MNCRVSPGQRVSKAMRRDFGMNAPGFPRAEGSWCKTLQKSVRADFGVNRWALPSERGLGVTRH